jgi:Domain of unknown function (DU1801)
MPPRRRVRAPSADHLAFLKPYGPAITDLVIAARRLVLEEAPESVELIYDAYNAVSAGYGFTGRTTDSFVYVAAYPKGVNIGFWAATLLPDPEGLLEGAGKTSRHVKIRSTADLDRPALRALIRAAIEIAERPEGKPPKPESIVRAIYANKRRPRV